MTGFFMGCALVVGMAALIAYYDLGNKKPEQKSE
jgi:hypothetical protein